MSSLRRINASRANGARSRGPITPEGKARSSRNATRHGLLSRQPITPDESDTGFKDLLADYSNAFAALPGVNPGILHQIALCRWRILRAWAMEKQWLDELIAADPHPDPRRQIANAFATLVDTNKYRLLFRYEGRLDRLYEQYLQTLVRVQTKNDDTNLIPFPDTLQIEAEPPQPIRAPETKNDESNLIPFSNTIQRKQPTPVTLDSLWNSQDNTGRMQSGPVAWNHTQPLVLEGPWLPADGSAGASTRNQLQIRASPSAGSRVPTIPSPSPAGRISPWCVPNIRSSSDERCSPCLDVAPDRKGQAASRSTAQAAGLRTAAVSGYVLDNGKATRDLTLNLGLR